MRSISRVTSRARQVGTVTSHSRCDLEPEAAREPFSGRRAATSRPITRSARSGRNRTTGRSGSPSWTSTWPVISAPARSTIIRLARTAAGSARYGSTPFSQRFDPAVRSASRSEVLRIPSGSKFAASSRTSVVVFGDLAFLPAHDRREGNRPLAVRDDQLGRLEPALHAVESAQLLPWPCATNDDPPAGESAAVERVQGAAPHVHHVVRHVDDVRDRAHVGEVKARPQPLRATARFATSRKVRPM